MIVEKVEEILESRNVFLTGGGGVGKSYLTKELVKRAKKKQKGVVVLGSTGVSAVNVEGQTIHSFFAFGISNTLEELQRHDRYVKKRIGELKKILSKCDLLVIDEISMVSASLLEMIHYRLRNGGFDGSLLFVGDFFQLPPVIKRDNSSLFGENEYAFESSSWEFFDPLIVELTKTKRTDDKEFFEILNLLRWAETDKKLINYLFGLKENRVSKNSTVLYGTNKEAQRMNLIKLQELKSEPVVLKANEKEHVKSLHVKRIENWKNSLPIPCDLTLKIGAKVLFCTNKWGKYYNGERGVIREIMDDYLIVEKEDSLVKVERQEYTMSESVAVNGELEDRPLYSIEQFPLKLAYAITIHKSQGMSIDELVCDIDNIFEKSQFYVALSRAKNPKNLAISFNRGDFERYLKNIIRVSPKVRDFYLNSKILKIEE